MGINADRLRAVASAIEAGTLAKFNMYDILSTDFEYDEESQDFHKCGTLACVAGFALLLFAKPLYGKNPHDLGGHQAADILGLDNTQRDELFYCDRSYHDPIDHFVNFEIIHKHEEFVPDALRWMADNDCIDWDQAMAAVGAPIKEI